MGAFRQWLIQKLGGIVKVCDHKWRILIEHYPSFTKDYWQCTRCNVAKVFENSDPPVPIQTLICNLGDVHIINGMKVADRKGKSPSKRSNRSKPRSIKKLKE